jgi:membrane-associated phospholipid phosphatase
MIHESPVERLAERIETDAETPRRRHIAAALHEIGSLDEAIYAAVAATPTPTLDAPLRRLSQAADRSVLWIVTAAAMAATGGRTGRRAAVTGLASVGVASALVNLGLKPWYRRTRPDRVGAGVPADRQVRMPGSTSFPSGHSASAFAFATGAGAELPLAALPLRVAATAVAYSRVHTGVHYPSDAIAGSVIGGVAGLIVGHVAQRADHGGLGGSRSTSS